MAKKKNTTPSKETGAGVLGQDFIGDMEDWIGTSTGSTLSEKQAALNRQKAMQPVLKAKLSGMVFDNVINKHNAAMEKKKSDLAKLLQEGAGMDTDLLNKSIQGVGAEILKVDNMSYRDIANQISGMNVLNPKYEDLAKKLNQIKVNAASLKIDNDKITAIKNEIQDLDISEWSKGLEPWQIEMYKDIIAGNGDNFVVKETDDGKRIYWVNPEEKTEYRVSEDDWWAQEFDAQTTSEKLDEVDNEDVNSLNDFLQDWSDSWYEKDVEFDPDQYENFALKKIQQHLVNLGYDLGTTGDNGDGVDGNWGNKSKAALKLFKEEYKSGGGKIGELIDSYRFDMYKTSVTTQDEYALSKIVGPTAKSALAEQTHIQARQLIQKNPNLDTNYLANSVFEQIGADGVKSMIFDGIQEVNSVSGAKYGGLLGDADTQDWFDSWYEENGIVEEEDKLKEYNRIKREGITAVGSQNGVSVKDHFMAWYADELKNANKGGNVVSFDTDDEEEEEEEKNKKKKIKVKTQKLTESNAFVSPGNTFNANTASDGSYFLTDENKNKLTYFRPYDGAKTNKTRLDYVYDYNNNTFLFTGYLHKDAENGGYLTEAHENAVKGLEAELAAWGGIEARDKAFFSALPQQWLNGFNLENKGGLKAGETIEISVPWYDEPVILKLEGQGKDIGLGDNKYYYQIQGGGYTADGKTVYDLDAVKEVLGIPNYFATAARGYVKGHENADMWNNIKSFDAPPTKVLNQNLNTGKTKVYLDEFPKADFTSKFTDLKNNVNTNETVKQLVIQMRNHLEQGVSKKFINKNLNFNNLSDDMLLEFALTQAAMGNIKIDAKGNITNFSSYSKRLYQQNLRFFQEKYQVDLGFEPNKSGQKKLREQMKDSEASTGIPFYTRKTLEGIDILLRFFN